MTSPSVDLKALRELLEKATQELEGRIGEHDGEIYSARADLRQIDPVTLARTALDQADRLEAITRELAEAKDTIEDKDGTIAQLCGSSNLNLSRAVNAEALVSEMTERMDRISSGGLYADLTARATAAEQALTAARKALEEIADICDPSKPFGEPEEFQDGVQRVCAKLVRIAVLAATPITAGQGDGE